MTKRVIVIGAGAAGLIAAGRAAEVGAEVILLEKMAEAGKKILVSGQERCNITNSAPVEKFLEHYGRNGQFLRNAYHRFFRNELLALLARYGVETQEERGGRIFPASGRAGDVRDALLRYATTQGTAIRYRTEVQRILVADGEVIGVQLQNGEHIPAHAVILATGGASWPTTGSTGDGYRMAQELGHTIVPLRPALVPLTVAERALAKALQGVSLRNVRCTFTAQKGDGPAKALRIPYPMPPTGEMLFTHFGVSGPLILTASLAVVDALRSGARVTLSIDLKPGMTEQEVHARLQREFEEHPQRLLSNLLKGWVPTALAEVLAGLSGVAADRPVHTIRAEERARIVALLKGFRWQITDSLPLATGMVTAGGVALKEVDPVSFESRLIRGLHIVGETLDIAADTGGFNLQAAFSSGYLAGEHAGGEHGR
ncbi:MAG TPA: NAD(P)/FAD-dependent oxidoreductase [Anaerolineae bacterium]|nr:NAD(P)/FAD-dependent oxidoreductase [Anaerolineae bacterium]HQK14573.1 NAD(P)/FAD-dependent oxidoreductase [Anaerolineae bacterium]